MKVPAAVPDSPAHTAVSFPVFSVTSFAIFRAQPPVSRGFPSTVSVRVKRIIKVTPSYCPDARSLQIAILSDHGRRVKRVGRSGFNGRRSAPTWRDDAYQDDYGRIGSGQFTVWDKTESPRILFGGRLAVYAQSKRERSSRPRFRDDSALVGSGKGGQFPERSIRATTLVRGAPGGRTPPESSSVSVEPSWLLQTRNTPSD